MHASRMRLDIIFNEEWREGTVRAIEIIMLAILGAALLGFAVGTLVG